MARSGRKSESVIWGGGSYPLTNDLGQDKEPLQRAWSHFKQPPPRTSWITLWGKVLPQTMAIGFPASPGRRDWRRLDGIEKHWRKWFVFPQEYLRANWCQDIISLSSLPVLDHFHWWRRQRRKLGCISVVTKLSFTIWPPAKKSFKASGLHASQI